VKEVVVNTSANVPRSKGLPDKASIPGVKNTIAVASGKGGVGKSTVAINLALSLAKCGASVGVLDADVFGPSLPTMTGLHQPLEATAGEKLIPLEKFGVKLVSVGFMLDEETPLIWRGPMVMQLVKQFLTGVEYGELDYLVIDLPPGTGDVQLTLAQTIPITGSVIVTTPQDVALIDARRAIKMFEELKVPIIGIVENMSYFVCPHCSGTTEIFSQGGAEKTGKRYNTPLLGKLPLDVAIREGGDSGVPVVEAVPDGEHAKVFSEIAALVASKLSVLDLS
ncbi:MAG: Mrp/NBP35 family ATP-binding protein, partial [Nitrospirota bacterium]|nr:Mrp/NBP35 family ATP-binding protein [Nitrospirota bacterium]